MARCLCLSIAQGNLNFSSGFSGLFACLLCCQGSLAGLHIAGIERSCDRTENKLPHEWQRNRKDHKRPDESPFLDVKRVEAAFARHRYKTGNHIWGIGMRIVLVRMNGFWPEGTHSRERLRVESSGSQGTNHRISARERVSPLRHNRSEIPNQSTQGNQECYHNSKERDTLDEGGKNN